MTPTENGYAIPFKTGEPAIHGQRHPIHRSIRPSSRATPPENADPSEPVMIDLPDGVNAPVWNADETREEVLYRAAHKATSSERKERETGRGARSGENPWRRIKPLLGG